MADFKEFFRGRNTLLSQKEQLLGQLEQAKQDKAKRIEAVELQLKQRQVELRDVENLEMGVAQEIEKIDQQVAQVEALMLEEQRAAIARLEKGRQDLESFALKLNGAASSFASVIRELNDIERSFRDDAWTVESKPFLHLSGFKNVLESLDRLPVLTRSEVHPDEWLLQELGGARSRRVPVPGFESEG